MLRVTGLSRHKPKTLNLDPKQAGWYTISLFGSGSLKGALAQPGLASSALAAKKGLGPLAKPLNP